MVWTLLDLGGAVALLLWGVHMAQSGLQRAYGPELRRFLRTALRNRLAAVGAGLGVTAVLQSSTATGLMVTGFAATGLVTLESALAVMLGANVGSTLVVQVLSFDVAAVAPGLLIAGVALFRRSGRQRWRDLGRVAIGLGLMLIALHQLVSAVAPYAASPVLAAVLKPLGRAPVLSVLIGALLTWAAHSSVAVVLFIMSLAGNGVLPEPAALALVLGANLGTAINPLLEGAGDDPVARRLPLGNLLIRIAGAAAMLPLLPPLVGFLAAIEPSPARAVADFHTAFNLALAVLMLPVLAPYAVALRRLLPQRAEDDPWRPRYLDRAALAAPTVALAAAAREALRMADALETMLTSAAEALARADLSRIAEVRRLDDVLDRLNAAIGAYLSDLDAEEMTEADQRRLSQTLVFSRSLESAGDVVERDVLGHAARRLKRGVPFPEAERAEGARLLRGLAGTARSAAAVFMTEDGRAARQLVAEKARFRELEAAAMLARGTSPVHAGELDLDLLRDLKHVNGLLVASAAYPVLEGQGALLPSRLRVDS